MPKHTEKTNQIYHDGPIDPPFKPFFTRVINGKRHVSHTELARQLGVKPATLVNGIDNFRMQSGQRDTVTCLGTTRWLDITAFSAFAQAHNVSDYLTQYITQQLVAPVTCDASTEAVLPANWHMTNKEAALCHL